jgi:integrase
MDLHETHQRIHGRGKKGQPLTEGTFEFYKTNRTYFRDYLATSKAISTCPESINTLWLTKYESYLLSRPLKQSSVNYAINYIKHVLSVAITNEAITKAPALHYQLKPITPTKPSPLTDLEIHKFESGCFCPAQQKAVDCFLFLRYTGLHYIDGKNITEASLMYDESGKPFLHVLRQKTGEPALIPYHPKAKAIIEKYGGLGKLPFTSQSNLTKRLRLSAQKVNVRTNITPGTGRDTFADDCSKSMKVSDESLAAMLGHTTTGQVKKYRRISINRIIAEWKE